MQLTGLHRFCTLFYFLPSLDIGLHAERQKQLDNKCETLSDSLLNVHNGVNNNGRCNVNETSTMTIVTLHNKGTAAMPALLVSLETP